MNARLDLDADHTVRLDLDVDRTARLGLAKRTVMPSVLRRRPGRQSDIPLREALRVRSGGAVLAAADRLTARCGSAWMLTALRG